MRLWHRDGLPSPDPLRARLRSLDGSTISIKGDIGKQELIERRNKRCTKCEDDKKEQASPPAPAKERAGFVRRPSARHLEHSAERNRQHPPRNRHEDDGDDRGRTHLLHIFLEDYSIANKKSRPKAACNSWCRRRDLNPQALKWALAPQASVSAVPPLRREKQRGVL